MADGATGSDALGDEQREAFETERAHLIGEITRGLREATAQLKNLNGNMQYLAEVGSTFEKSAVLWTDFAEQVSKMQS